MENTVKTDLRVKKTQAAIKRAFKEMIMEMSPSEIQVKELAKRAEIHRKTFYLHYTCIEALFEEMIQEVANAYYAKIDQIQEFFDKTLRVTLMQHNRARHNPYEYLPAEEQNVINIFLTKSSNNMYRQWVADGKKIPLERIIELTGELLTNGIADLAR